MDSSSAAMLDLKECGLSDPLLVTTSGSVAEKLEVARLADDFATLGDDLVAQCVNGVLCAGAKPLLFSYRLAGVLGGEGAARAVVEGIARACRRAGCQLLVDHSTLAPSSGSVDSCELTGFAVGAVERCRAIAAPVVVGDVILGISEVGVVGGVVSITRRAVDDAGISLSDPAPFSKDEKTFGSELLTPATLLCGRALLSSVASAKVKALVPLSADSLERGVARALPSHLSALLDASTWQRSLPALLGWLAAHGVTQDDLLTGSSCGLAALLIVAQGDVDDVVALLQPEVTASVVGSVVSAVPDTPRVGVVGLSALLEASWPRPPAWQAAQKKRRVAVLVTDCGKNLRALIDATRDPRRRTNAEIVLVVSNKAGVEGLDIAARAGIATKTIHHRDFPTRLDFDMAVHAALTLNQVDLVCLARFVRILTGEFTRLWRGRVINLHPAILPLFKGIHVQKQALDAGVRLTGCTVHFVEEAVDAGAIILQEPLAIEPRDTVESLLERMKRLEVRIYPRALALVATGRIAVGLDGRIVWNY